MNRYIDADAFVLKVVQSGGGADFINKVTGLMLDAPTIDIVHCRECKLSKVYRGKRFREFYRWCHENIRSVEDDSFCSYGERE